MKPPNPLLVAIVILGGLGEAIPFKAGYEIASKWLSKRTEPAYTTITLGPGATSYQFSSHNGWETDPKLTDKGAKAVLKTMKKDGLFTAIILKGAETSCVGVKEGTTTPDQFVLSNVKDTETCLVTNGGFFVTGGDPYLRSDYKDWLLDSASVMYFAVGETSVTPNQVPIPGAHQDQYHRLQGDDGSYLMCGPDLKEAVDSSDPDYSKPNTLVNRLHYFAPSWESGPNKIPSRVWDEQVKWDIRVHDLLAGREGVGLQNDMDYLTKLGRPAFSMKKVTWCEGAAGKKVTEEIKFGDPIPITATVPVRAATDGASEFIRSVFAHIPGGVATVNEPNERAVLVFVGGGVKVVCAYTSAREAGMRIGEMRNVIDAFLHNFTFTGISGVQQALNLDGGASIFIGWMKNGKLRVLASGGLEKQQAGAKDPAGLKFRAVTTLVKHVLK